MRKLNSVEKDIMSFVPKKVFYTLKECCEFKGVSYKTLCNRVEFQPNKGRGDIVCGRKVFRYDIVINWLFETDNDI